MKPGDKHISKTCSRQSPSVLAGDLSTTGAAVLTTGSLAAVQLLRQGVERRLGRTVAVFAPAGTRAPMIERLGRHLTATLRAESIERQPTQTQGVNLIVGGSDAFQGYFHIQMRMWAAVVRENSIKLH